MLASVLRTTSDSCKVSHVGTNGVFEFAAPAPATCNHVVGRPQPPPHPHLTHANMLHSCSLISKSLERRNQSGVAASRVGAAVFHPNGSCFDPPPRSVPESGQGIRAPFPSIMAGLCQGTARNVDPQVRTLRLCWAAQNHASGITTPACLSTVPVPMDH